MKKNAMALILTACMASAALAGCASSGDSAGGSSQAEAGQTTAQGSQEDTQEASSEAADGKVNLVFWTGLSGQAGEVIQQVVDDYNSSQDAVFVDLQYQGSYQESLNKLKTSMRTVQIGIGMLLDAESADYNVMMAGVIIVMLPTLLLFTLGQKYILSGALAGAVKG